MIQKIKRNPKWTIFIVVLLLVFLFYPKNFLAFIGFGLITVAAMLLATFNEGKNKSLN